MCITAGMLLCSLSTIGQSISGQIKNENEVVPFANVLLLNSSDSLLIKGAVSDVDGNFNLMVQNSGDYLLKISSIGYEERFQTISANSSSETNLGTILISEQAEKLDEVVVEATKPLFEQRIDRTVINVQSSITASAGTALDVLEKSPGITIDRANNSLSLAGKQGVRIMINGKMSRMPLAAAVQMLNGMNAENVESIELITTPPAKYEAEGDAGIINIVLKQTADSGTNGSYSLFAGYGENYKWGGTVNINHRNKKFNVFGNYSFRRDFTYQTFGNNRILEMDNMGTQNEINTNSFREPLTDTHNARIGFDYQLSDKTVIGMMGTFFSYYWDMDAVNRTTTDEHFNGTTTPLSITTLNNEEINDWGYYVGNASISHDINASNNLSIELDYIVYDSNNPVDYEQIFEDLDGNQGGDSTTYFRSSKITPLSTWVPRIDYSLKVNDNTTLEMGLKAAFNELENDVKIEDLVGDEWVINPELSQLAFLHEDIYAAYASMNFKISESLDAKIGIRYEHTITDLDTEEEQNVVYRNYGNLFPSVFLNKKINKENSWVLSYSRRITRPTFRDIAPFVIFLDPFTFYTGNESLLPSITDAFKAEFRHKSYLFSLQYSRDDNAIARFQPSLAEDGETQLGSAENMDFRDNFNLAVTLPFDITDWWEMQYNVIGSYQITEASYLEAPVRVEAMTLTLNGSNSFKLPKNWTFEISGFYGSPAYFGISKFDHYGALNLGIEKKLKNDGGTFRLTFTDTFNTRNFRGETYVPEENLNINRWFYLESQILNLTYTQNFGNKKLKKIRNKGNASQEEQNRIGN